MTTVQIGPVTFQPQTVAGFCFTKLVDWYTLSESKVDVRERPTADGAFGIDLDVRESQAISVEGYFLGTDETDAARAKLTLLGALGDGRPKTITVTDPLGPTTRTVSIRKVTIPDDLESDEWNFAIDMIATDRRRYGPEAAPFTGMPTSGTGFVWPAVWPADWGSGGDPGRVSATNDGTASTFPILEVTGGLSGGVELVEITTGSILRLLRPIPASSTVFFNTRTQRAYLDNPSNDITSDMDRKVWWSIPAGATRTVQFNGLGTVTGTPKLTVRFSPAY